MDLTDTYAIQHHDRTSRQHPSPAAIPSTGVGKSTDDEMHFQVDVPNPIACEECGVQGEFVRFGKRDVPLS